MTRAIVMAGGDDARWTELGGVGRRHFAVIGAETVLERTVRQLRARGVEDIVVVAPRALEGYSLPGIRRVDATYQGWGAEALNALEEWSRDGRTIQVYGDTVFTEAAMTRVIAFRRRRFQAFGRHGPGGVSRWGELFALSFWPEGRGPWERALRHVFDLRNAGIIGRAGSWEAYRFLGGARGSTVGQHRRYAPYWTEIDDGTDDFDTPAELEALTALAAGW